MQQILKSVKGVMAKSETKAPKMEETETEKK